jgi:hypothetical protein
MYHHLDVYKVINQIHLKCSYSSPSGVAWWLRRPPYHHEVAGSNLGGSTWQLLRDRTRNQQRETHREAEAPYERKSVRVPSRPHGGSNPYMQKLGLGYTGDTALETEAAWHLRTV